MSQISKEKVIETLIKSVEKSQREYVIMSGGLWLWNAPEYLLTVNVAKEITKVQTGIVTMESNVSGSMNAAGARAPGPNPAALRASGKFDAVMYFANGKPRFAIELKNQIVGMSTLGEDLVRLEKTILTATDKSSWQSGFSVFYYSEENADGVVKSIRDKLASWEVDAMKYLNHPDRVRLTFHHGSVHTEIENNAWVAVVIELSPC